MKNIWVVLVWGAWIGANVVGAWTAEGAALRGYSMLAAYGVLMMGSQILLVWIAGQRGLPALRWSAGWLWAWHWRLLAMVLAGAVLGGLAYTVVGGLAGIGASAPERVRAGAFDGGFYALIWAPGISFVWCVMLGHRRMRAGIEEGARHGV